MQDFRNLKVWALAHEMTLMAYRETRSLPADERFGLKSQMRRAAYSVPMNIAEGCGAPTDRAFAVFLHHAMSSACEYEYQLLLARDLTYFSSDQYESLNSRVTEVKRMLAALLAKLDPG